MLLPLASAAAAALSLSTPSLAFAVPPRPLPCHRFQWLQTPPRRRRCTHHMMSTEDFGLTDDGDFALFGVNAEEAPEDDASAAGGTVSPNVSVNTGTSIGWQGVGGMLFNEPLLKSGRVDLGAGSNNRFRDFRGNDIVPKIDPAVKDWLLGTLPSLDEIDVNAYAEGLSNLGFNPQCASLCELRYEDLDFMKLLHRRYLYKEITGEDHPFEP